MGRIYPSWEQIDELRVSLTDGERTLARFLDEHLPGSWSIYVQPYVNDMRPDVVVRNPNIGIVVFEVKDWELDRYRFEHGRMIGHTATDTWVEDDPVRKATGYARRLYEQFLICDEAELELGTHPNDMVLCRAAVYFHKASTQEARRLYAGYQQIKIIHGADALVPAELESLVTYARSPHANYVRERQTKALEGAHSWLVPPRHAIEQQQQTRLTTGQAGYAKPDKGFRRIRGVAGAGKSFVLSHRAACANQEGRRILLLSFTITMGHVLRDLLKRAPFDVDWERVTYGHFHEWAVKQGIEAGFITTNAKFGCEDNQPFPPDQHEDQQSQSDTESLTSILERIVSRDSVAREYTQPLYDGIYIDEGQDFAPSWLDALAGFLADDGELVLFADHKQNIYEQDGGRDTRRTMRRCRFSGPWAQLMPSVVRY